MATDHSSYPLCVFTSAINTIVGRVILVVVTVLAGFGLGGMTATHSLYGFLAGLLGFPSIVVAAVFVSYGATVFPFCLLYIIINAKYQLKAWTLLIPLTLCWLVSHDTIYWITNESPAAHMQVALKAVATDVEQAKRQAEQQHEDVPSEAAGRQDSAFPKHGM